MALTGADPAGAAEAEIEQRNLDAAAAVETDDGAVLDVDVVEIDPTDEDLSDAPESSPAEVAALVESESLAVAIQEHRNRAVPALSVLPGSGEWEAMMVMARTISSTQFVPESYRNNPEAVVAAILTGREMGIGPMESMRQIHMIDGRPAFSADLMLSKMREGGLMILDSIVTDTRCWIHAKRRDTGEEAQVEWTIEDAAAAGLTGKKNWKTYPADMLWARVVGRLARRLGSDLLGGMVYAAEEMQDWDEGGYGGSGYDTSPRREGKADTSSRPTTNDGKITLLDGAPLGWPALGAALDEIDASMDWAVWVSQALTALVGKAKFAELTEDEKKDCGIKIANGVKHLADSWTGEFPPPTRAEIQAAFGFADSIDVLLEGPEGPLSPDEAAGDAVSEADPSATDDAGEGAADAQEPSESAEDTDPLRSVYVVTLIPKGTTSTVEFECEAGSTDEAMARAAIDHVDAELLTVKLKGGD